MANPNDTLKLNRILMEIANLKSVKSSEIEKKPEVELATQKSGKVKDLMRQQTSVLGIKRIERLQTSINN